MGQVHKMQLRRERFVWEPNPIISHTLSDLTLGGHGAWGLAVSVPIQADRH